MFDLVQPPSPGGAVLAAGLGRQGSQKSGKAARRNQLGGINTGVDSDCPHRGLATLTVMLFYTPVDGFSRYRMGRVTLIEIARFKIVP